MTKETKIIEEAIAVARKGDYQPYTTQFDRVVNAAELPGVPLSKKFGHWKSLKKYSELVGQLQTEVSDFVEELPHDRTQALRSIAKNIAVTVLVDHSNSLNAHGITETAVCAVYTLLCLLDKLGIRHEVLGFTTQSWHGGKSRKLWLKNNRPENPGRLCDLLHIIYKSHDDDEKAHSQLILRNLLRADLLRENIDGEAIEWAASRLAGRVEQNKILLHVSDGAPVDDATLLANSDDYLIDHFQSVIKALEKGGKIRLYGIGLHFRVSEFCLNSVNIETASDAPRILCKYIVDLLVEQHH